ncbi:type II secretion system F family protein [Paenibacillus hamazuiensis]|uniref:type II secretion system F family protein n=1 Tax=Paenibacillus hamazuiensis TaxID=2936508 RepID=UPI00200DFB9B|nr:type II secretion system F family protein [Paenibacillus hamazuiensis]
MITDYRVYKMTAKEKVVSMLLAGALLACIGTVFYKSAVMALLIALLGILYPAMRAKQLAAKRRQLLNMQFKQALSGISSAIGAGKSVETAFLEAVDDLKLLYPDPNTFIIRELELINRKIEIGGTIEAALLDFSARSGSDDIRNFTDVFVTCKRTGGNLIHVIRRTASIIHEKLEIEQEIAVMMSQKKFESRLLTFAPLVVVGLLAYSSPDYMAPLYNGIGYVVMSVCLLVLFGCYKMTERIMDIKV